MIGDHNRLLFARERFGEGIVDRERLGRHADLAAQLVCAQAELLRHALGGIRAGDRILTVAGDDIDTWEDLYIAIATRPDRDVAVTLLRDGRTEAVTVHPVAQGRFEIGDVGVLPDVNPQVRSLFAGDPAERAGVTS